MTRGDVALTERSPPTVLYELPINVPQFAFNAGGGLGLYFWDLEVDSGPFGEPIMTTVSSLDSMCRPEPNSN